MAETRRIVRATKEITVNIRGELYDCLLVPQQTLSEVDFTDCPEDDPIRRECNIVALTKVDLQSGDIIVFDSKDGGWFRLTEAGAKRLLDSL